MKTYAPKEADIQRKWFLVDADGQVLGRMATRIATILRGKDEPGYAPNVDMGDFVVVINAEKVKLTGNKLNDKLYQSHSGYPGGFKEQTASELMEKHPERIIENAIKGMLPRNRLRAKILKKLKVYKGSAHPHEAQNPEPLTLDK
ncbi:MAG TPA: 50S ribosomal protein L13 [Thermoanaerobaculia bacterium]|nr:50S ribosomal protein L13 [Thermoanaerobaculia bacterium]HUM29576.1 50S ribosomal protein L13 [Thermoanaerobaculia bacterium]HXK67959.1 50S ribosomal protein L13 [Thermoanaerobaculia bacterium]